MKPTLRLLGDQMSTDDMLRCKSGIIRASPFKDLDENGLAVVKGVLSAEKAQRLCRGNLCLAGRLRFGL